MVSRKAKIEKLKRDMILLAVENDTLVVEDLRDEISFKGHFIIEDKKD